MLERLEEVSRDANFSDGDGVDPDAPGEVGIGPGAQPTSDVPKNAAAPERLNQRDGEVREEREGGQETVEEQEREDYRVADERAKCEDSKVYVWKKTPNAGASSSV